MSTSNKILTSIGIGFISVILFMVCIYIAFYFIEFRFDWPVELSDDWGTVVSLLSMLWMTFSWGFYFKTKYA